MDDLDVPVLQGSNLSPSKQPPDELRADTVPSSPASSVRRELSSRADTVPSSPASSVRRELSSRDTSNVEGERPSSRRRPSVESLGDLVVKEHGRVRKVNNVSNKWKHAMQRVLEEQEREKKLQEMELRSEQAWRGNEFTSRQFSLSASTNKRIAALPPKVPTSRTSLMASKWQSAMKNTMALQRTQRRVHNEELETDIGGSWSPTSSAAFGRTPGRTPHRTPHRTPRSSMDSLDSYPPRTPHRGGVGSSHPPRTPARRNSGAQLRPSSRGSGVLSMSASQRWKLATARTVAALRRNTVAPEDTVDNEGSSSPVTVTVRPAKLPPLQPSTSGILKGIVEANGETERTDKLVSRSSSNVSVAVTLSDTESPGLRNVRDVRSIPVAPSSSPTPSPPMQSGGLQGKSHINFGLARKIRQRYSTHYGKDTSSEPSHAEQGQGQRALPRVSEMLSKSQLKEEAKKHMKAKKILAETWDTTEEEEKLNQAGHKLINPEKHLHVHPVFRPKQYSYPDLLACIPVVLPNSKFVESFDFVMSFLLVYIAIIAPVDMAFLEPKYDALFVFNRTIDCYFLMDFALQFNLATPNQYGRLLIDRREIADKYIHGWMLIDLLSLVPFDLLVMLGLFAGLDQIKGLRLIRLLRLMKMLRLLRANRMFSRLEAKVAVDYSQLQLYAYLAVLLLLMHWLACGWYMIITVELNVECVVLEDTRYADSLKASGDMTPSWGCCFNWLDCYRYAHFNRQTSNIEEASGEQQSKARQYFLALVWSTGEVLTVGSDIHPTTDSERAFQVVARVLAGLMYAYLLGAVCSIFTAMSRDRTKYYESMDHLNKFLHEKHLHIIDPSLCSQLRMFYRFAHSRHESGHMHEVLEHISPTLRGKVAWRVHSRWLMRMPLFKGSRISMPFYTSLALHMESRLFCPLEAVIEAHHEADTLFVMEKGMLITKGPQAVKTPGAYFGEDSVAAWRVNQLRGYNATSFTHGSTYALKVEFLFVIMARPQYIAETRPLVKKVFWARVQHLVGFFSNTLKNAAEDGETFLEGCEYVWEDLSFVDSSAMHLILQIFARVYKEMKRVAFDSDLAVNLFLQTQEDSRMRDSRLLTNLSDDDEDGSHHYRSPSVDERGSQRNSISVRRPSNASQSSRQGAVNHAREARLLSPGRIVSTRRPSNSFRYHDFVAHTPSRMMHTGNDLLDMDDATADLDSDHEGDVRTLRSKGGPGSQNPTDDTNATTANSNVLMMRRLLEPVGLQHLAQALNDDDIDAEMLMKMSAIELKACGASMGKALKFVATREQSSTT